MALAGRDRRAVLGAGAAVALFLLLRFAVFPAWDRLREQRSELSLREMTLVKYRQALQAAGSQDEAAQSLASRLREEEAGLLQNSNPALASAELQDWVKQITAGHGIEVPSSAFLPIRTREGGYAEVPLGVQFQCRLDQLVNFLADVAAAPRILTVPRLSIQATGGKEKLVNVSMTVAGLIRAPANQGVGNRE